MIAVDECFRSHVRSFTHWGRVTHICVSKLIIIGSDNGLSPGRRQAIIWTNAGILLIGPLRTYFSEILGKVHSFSFNNMHLKMSSAKGRLFMLGLNELIYDTIAADMLSPCVDRSQTAAVLVSNIFLTQLVVSKLYNTRQWRRVWWWRRCCWRWRWWQWGWRY